MLCVVLVYLCELASSSPCDLCAALDASETGRTISLSELPFTECITLPETASFALKELFGPTTCCNPFCQRPVWAGKETRPVYSELSLSFPCRGEASVAVGSATMEVGIILPQPNEAGAQEDAAGLDVASDSATHMVPSPASNTNNQGYQTAWSARMIGRPKLVSVSKANDATTATETERPDSVRRPATKLGAKAVRREVAILYKPRESVAPEDANAEEESQSTAAAEDSTEPRRSRRLLEKQQKEQPQSQSASKPSAVSKSSVSDGTSLPRTSRLREENMDGTVTLGSSGRSDWDHLGTQAQNKSGSVPSLSLMMADWEIAPGRIRVRDGVEGIVESEWFPHCCC